MNITYIVVSAAIVAALTLTYFLLAKKSKSNPKSILPIDCKVAILPDNIIDKKGEITMIEVVEWFKNLPLDKNKHAPFVANQELLLTVAPAIFVEAGKQALFLGVLNEDTKEIEFSSVMIGDSFSVDLKSTLGDEKIIVLS